jgi:ubiquinone/menaquinone biosynthesis C-methylase UbiE
MKYQIKSYLYELTFAIYNWEKNIQFKTTEQLMKYVAYNYECVGDFCCGYGQPLFDFLKYGGKQVVASDHNDSCISILKDKMETYEKNI